MKTLKKVSYTPVFLCENQEMPEMLEEYKVYIMEDYGIAKHLCLCGCKELTVMPIDDGQKWWQLVKETNGTVSFIGSVGNYCFECKSHYIMTKNIANFV